ncbi:ribonuclease H-like domain-containing protein [Tanacetum coccineum]
MTLGLLCLNTNIGRCIWLFRHKYLADDTLSHYKACLVANDNTQIEGIDVDETFSLVVKPGTIQTVFSLAISRHWPVHQLAVKKVYIHQPPGFQDYAHLDYVCLLQRSLYGLKQGIYVMCDSLRMFLSKHMYATEILKRAHMVGCNSSRNPVDTESKLGDDGDLVYDPTLYRSLAGSFQYLTFTCPDISYAVQQVCLYFHDPPEPHFSALKQILRYVRGTLAYRLQLFSSSTTSLVAYSDADQVGFPKTRRSTSCYCVFLGNNLLLWSSKRQPTLPRSSAEEEYRGVANVVVETLTVIFSGWIVYKSDRKLAFFMFLHDISMHIFTKGSPSALFEEFCTSLSVQCSPTQTLGEC